MLMAIIESIYETMNLRIQETAFELHLRKIYPTRNILSLRETETVSGQEGLDVQKKTDGSVNIIGEVATDPVAAWMIQAAQVASKFTLFTHHAKTFPNLVTALRNSMLRTGVFNNERTAEEQVVQVLNFDIHLIKDFRGRRYIERVTECIPVEEKNEYTFDHRKEKTLEGKFDKFFDNATIFFSKTTNRELYKYQNILEFVDDKYVLSNPISETNIKEMRLNMNETDQIEFDKFLERNWGIKPPKTEDYGEVSGEPVKVLKPKAEVVKENDMATEFKNKMNLEAQNEINTNSKNIIPKNIESPKMDEKLTNDVDKIEEEKPKKRVIKNLFGGKSKPKEDTDMDKTDDDLFNNPPQDNNIQKPNNNPPRNNMIRNELLGGLDVNFDFGDDDDDDDDDE